LGTTSLPTGSCSPTTELRAHRRRIRGRGPYTEAGAVGSSAPHSGLRPPHGDVEQRIRGHGSLATVWRLLESSTSSPARRSSHGLTDAAWSRGPHTEASIAGSLVPPSRVELPCADVEQQSWLGLGLTGAASRGRAPTCGGQAASSPAPPPGSSPYMWRLGLRAPRGPRDELPPPSRRLTARPRVRQRHRTDRSSVSGQDHT
jgi:hypothetical protein